MCAHPRKAPPLFNARQIDPLQYCNHGTLGDAIDRGWLRRSPGGPPNMRAILNTAQASLLARVAGRALFACICRCRCRCRLCIECYCVRQGAPSAVLPYPPQPSPALQEVATALCYLHHHSVLHGDLSCGNVLLTTARHESKKDRRSFQAKVLLKGWYC